MEAGAVDVVEYLIGYGLCGDFGRFRPVRPLVGQRGQRVVVRTHRGLEIGEVLCEATPRHAHFLPNNTVGSLLRIAGPEDEAAYQHLRQRAARLFARASDLAGELALPLDVLDAEVLLDGEHAVVHQLRFADCDVRPFVSTLSRELDLQLALVDLNEPATHEEHGDCGSCGSGGCGSCGSGGGCGTCGSAKPEEVQAYFADLRQQMEHRHPLL